MPHPYALPLVCLLAGCSLIQGCATPMDGVAAYTASDIANPQPVIQKAMQKSLQRMVHSTESSAESAAPARIQAAPVARKSEPPTQVSPVNQASPVSQVSQVKTIKPDTQTGKANQKLTPQEVDDIIRKLSVCRPH